MLAGRGGGPQRGEADRDPHGGLGEGGEVEAGTGPAEVAGVDQSDDEDRPLERREAAAHAREVDDAGGPPEADQGQEPAQQRAAGDPQRPQHEQGGEGQAEPASPGRTRGDDGGEQEQGEHGEEAQGQ
jgi:hypothetical protein